MKYIRTYKGTSIYVDTAPTVLYLHMLNLALIKGESTTVSSWRVQLRYELVIMRPACSCHRHPSRPDRQRITRRPYLAAARTHVPSRRLAA
jgi:hypothetical protein